LKAVWGSPLYADFVPVEDELTVARLRSAGAVIVGKTNCPEFTLQGYTDNLPFGVTRNPWNIELTPGGSSAGAAAAVAAGIGPVGVGTDGGGSIRRPSAYTGLVGLKPSRGRVPRVGGFPMILPDLETIGPMARTVSDVINFMTVVSGHDVRDPSSFGFQGHPFRVESKSGCRILHVPYFGDYPIDPEISDSIAAAARCLADLGHEVEEGPAPFDVAEVEGAWPAISQVGLAWHLMSKEPWKGRVGWALEQTAVSGSQYPATTYFAALDVARSLERQLGSFFETFDLILTPSIAALPWPAKEIYPTKIAGHQAGPRGHAVFTGFVNMSGCCAINVPARTAKSGLPIGFQLVGARGADGLVCGIAAQYEAASPWAGRRPSL
jgi:aspartyl-tRNA(Asn)/glutamyl-tRNA(Gln) amidotransferase subunit A